MRRLFRTLAALLSALGRVMIDDAIVEELEELDPGNRLLLLLTFASATTARSATGARSPLRYFQNCREAMRAPSASDASFAQTTSGSTAACPTQVP
jgi:hypothetical protein